MSTRIPTLLEPYLSLPPEEGSLALLTGVLGASTNWLLLRFLHSALRPPSSREESSGSKGNGAGSESQQDTACSDTDAQTAVVLVSFLRDFAFWKDGAARLGLDLEAFARKGRFFFADGLGALGAGPDDSGAAGGRGPPAGKAGPAQQQQQQQQQKQWGWNLSLRAGKPTDLSATVEGALDGLKAKGLRVILLVDQIDALVAITGGEVYSEQVVRDIMLDWREVCSVSVLAMPMPKSYIRPRN